MNRLLMKKRDSIYIFMILFLAIFSTIHASLAPYFSIRSQGQHDAIEMAGWYVNQISDEKETFKGNVILSSVYSQSFHPQALARALFGSYSTQNCTTLSIKGSAVSDRTENDLLADWFYLAPNYQGSVLIKPRIQNVTTALNVTFDRSNGGAGWYLFMRAPLTWSRWNLKSVFLTEYEGTLTTPYGVALADADTFFCAKATDFNTTFTATPLTCARFGCNGCNHGDEQSTIRFTDVQANLGYRFNFKNDAYSLGLFGRLVAPLGNAPSGEWLFEPIVGNGKHWEVGLGMHGGIRLWQDKDALKEYGFYGDVTLTHLFAARHNRVFDLKNKPLSRYMTAAHFVDDSIVTYAPLANLTSCTTKISAAVQADIVVLFNYVSRNWSYDLGYNLWVKSCEKIECFSRKCQTCCGKCIIKNGSESWGIATVGSSQTASESTIVEKASSDLTPVFITNDDIDYDGVCTQGFSNTLFTHIDYCWIDTRYVPHVGCGCEVEIGSSSCNSDSSSCCKNIALSQWGVWFKGGLSF